MARPTINRRAFFAFAAVPYKLLIDAGVEFRACLGNHDNPNQRFYKPFNMGGERYYTFHPPKNSDGKSDVRVALLRHRHELPGEGGDRLAGTRA